MKRTERKARSVCSAAPGFKSKGSGVGGQGSGHRATPTTGTWRVFALGITVAFFFHLSSCGVKAPPQPRELVVPAPVEDVAVEILPVGIEVTFTLPSRSLDGSPLEVIGGYRIMREGPEGKAAREDVWFSVSEMRQRVGMEMIFLDDPPSKAGTYRYCVIPFDIYGSYPGESRTKEFCWEGTLPGKGN